MARWYPLLLGPLFEASDRKAAEAEAAKQHGQEAVGVISHLDLEQDRAERSAGNRRRAREHE